MWKRADLKKKGKGREKVARDFFLLYCVLYVCVHEERARARFMMLISVRRVIYYRGKFEISSERFN